MSHHDIKFRRYMPADADAVMKLHIEALHSTDAFIEIDGYYADLDDISNEYVASGGEFLVGETVGGIVAMGGLQVHGDGVSEIRRMRVAPSMQGLGIGRELLTRLEEAAAERGSSLITLDTTENQLAAQSLFIRCCYREVGRGSKGSALQTIFFEKSIRPSDGHFGRGEPD